MRGNFLSENYPRIISRSRPNFSLSFVPFILFFQSSIIIIPLPIMGYQTRYTSMGAMDKQLIVKSRLLASSWQVGLYFIP
jgi:hypothetical protein